MMSWSYYNQEAGILGNACLKWPNKVYVTILVKQNLDRNLWSYEANGESNFWLSSYQVTQDGKATVIKFGYKLTPKLILKIYSERTAIEYAVSKLHIHPLEKSI